MKNLMHSKFKTSSNTSRISCWDYVQESIENAEITKIAETNREVSKFNPKNYISQQKIKTMSSIVCK